MSLIFRLPKILEEGRRIYYEQLEQTERQKFVPTEQITSAGGKQSSSENMLVLGDNGPFMSYLLNQSQLAGRINLIYIDPPFFSKTDYGTELKLHSSTMKTIPVMKQKAYHDTWENGMEEYLVLLTSRLYLMKDLLAEDGSIFVHLDWHASHYVKLILDEIFSETNFVNEIIWQYKSGGVSKRYFAKKHDTILFYAKSSQYYFSPQQEKSYNRGYKPYRFKGVKEYKDELGWYTMVNQKDVWQLDMVGRTSAERTGYVTQKPEALIERILESCTKRGDLCADFFGGSGTMAAAADRMGRRWISCDIGKLATINSQKRLIRSGASFTVYEEEKERLNHLKGTPTVDIALQHSPLSDKMMLRIELKGYESGALDEVPVEPKYQPILKKILQEDPIQLVDYWSVDTKGKEGVYQPDITFCKGTAGIETSYETFCDGSFPIRVKVVDIFGNSGFLSLEKGELE